MRKHKPIKMPPLFKRDKDLLSIINNPTKMAALKSVVDSAKTVSENMKKPKTLESWLDVVRVQIPEISNKQEFTQKLERLVYEYSDEPERNNPA